ncbi:MAG TPA: ABC-2 family transporter protein [Candidatus Ozemobacteraceae bacterium]|nr:ABC-2 family transporter protein [Candidatus Ozemobacteraceae bacterium]
MNPRTDFGRWFSVSRQLAASYLQMALAYRGMMIIWGFQMLLMPCILMLAWLSVGKSAGSAYSDGDYLLYYFSMPFVMNLTDCWTVQTFPEQIRDGSLSRSLLKPVHPLWLHVLENVTHKMVQLSMMLLPMGILAWVIHDRLPGINLSPSKLLSVVFVVFLAMSLRFVQATTLAMTGFWIEHVETLNLVLNQGIWALMGGMIVPVETSPPTVKWIAGFLPYRYSLSFPIEVLRGHLSVGEAVTGVIIATFWILLFLVAGRMMWRRGLRSYTAYGG